MSSWVRELTSEGQMRWLGPEKGVIQMAAAAIINAFWDLWGKMEKKPVWKLLCDMTPEQIVTLIDFRYKFFHFWVKNIFRPTKKSCTIFNGMYYF